jgi:putative ABC transport system ATP-binding protein
MTTSVSRLAAASKVFDEDSGAVTAVDEATISVAAGETVGIVGPSGSGKTTLLSLMGLLLVPTSGKAFFQEQEAEEMSATQRRRLRLTKVGFVFQQLRLIPTLSVLENVELPLLLNSAHAERRRAKGMELVTSVGLKGKEDRRPSHLSIGEQQRVAVARALVNDPLLLLADEPSSQLDSATGMKIVELLIASRDKLNSAVVISTHDPKICGGLDRVYGIRDGLLTPQANVL